MANALPTLGFVEAVKICFNKFIDIKTRARRSEYWWWYLFTLIVGLVLGWVPIVGTIISIALIVPNVTVTVRRLHDVGLSGWYYLAPIGLSIGVVLLALIAGALIESSALGIAIYVIGFLAIFVWWLFFVLIKDSVPGVNKWGDSPKYPTEA